MKNVTGSARRNTSVTHHLPILLIKKKENIVIMSNSNKRQRTTASSHKGTDKPEKPVVATFYEMWDVAMFNAIAELVLPPELKRVIDKMYKDINRTNSS